MKGGGRASSLRGGDLAAKSQRRYDVLVKWDTPSFDDMTRKVIAARLEKVHPIRFRSADAARHLGGDDGGSGAGERLVDCLPGRGVVLDRLLHAFDRLLGAAAFMPCRGSGRLRIEDQTSHQRSTNLALVGPVLQDQ
jgi:hypothetical protein